MFVTANSIRRNLLGIVAALTARDGVVEGKAHREGRGRFTIYTAHKGLDYEHPKYGGAAIREANARNGVGRPPTFRSPDVSV